MALRFVANGHLLSPPGPIASREPNDSLLSGQLRFGALYFMPMRMPVSMQLGGFGWVRCIRGRDTMRVMVYHYPFRDGLLDSIPFRPGFYKLSLMPDLMHPGCDSVSFAAYYRQHEAELARANPFAGYCFPERTPQLGPRVPADITPTVPTDIYAYLVERQVYCRMNHFYKLEPFPSGTSRGKFAEMGAFR